MIKYAVIYLCGMVGMWSFCRTAYVHTGGSRWFYVGDAALALAWFGIAMVLIGVIQLQR